ncbi:peptidylprolyl isomerase [Ancylomarina euxinus]|uniref:Peptidylprolyl isomerase n=1 Tax=Ancylomarina euxinus TaxID=2283627 RepID=A0A425XX28_9BACT|nr:peptidylprolyl isomerase [Ancylomarina euxinus]MCZ4696242.1 peptidylprolyl isomerase [Ancylomarina euxinus]MUP16617.1 peptidylprolyl isomerase [Ancylomarina euxinus]RRG19204.1 peptidylprolyl isomerase [Ancylomarina euxinus]
MRNIIFKVCTSLALLAIVFSTSQAQDNSIDKIIAVVGNQVVLKSDVENRFLGLKAQGYEAGSVDLKSEIFEDLLIEKLMIAQAQVDSIEVTEQEVENDIQRKIEMYIQKIGSKEKLEQYFKKSIPDMKNELRDMTRNDKIKQKMQAEITKNITATPAEVRDLYSKISQDSLPIIPGELQIQQISKSPKITDAEKDRIREKLRIFRDRIMKGESFATLAVLYSEDPGSAQRGGELGYTPRANLVPEFANEAFNLKAGKISKIVESEYGFHIIQLIDRKGDRINVRHILLKPRIKQEDRTIATEKLDSIADMIRNDKIKFEEAAFYYSDDKDTKNNGGLIVNPYNASSKFTKDGLPPSIAKAVTKLKVGEISEAFLDDQRGQETYKIIKIKSETKPHKANLSDDWGQFENMLKQQKQQDLLNKWISEKQSSTYISVDDSYKNAKFRFKNWIK